MFAVMVTEPPVSGMQWEPLARLRIIVLWVCGCAWVSERSSDADVMAVNATKASRKMRAIGCRQAAELRKILPITCEFL